MTTEEAPDMVIPAEEVPELISSFINRGNLE